MSRRDEEPVDVAWFDSREQAEAAWSGLMEAGVPCSILSDAVPWGDRAYRIQCARRDAPTALEFLASDRS